ncbi:MAG TPA: sigma-70 family RNA polymerase sigma factor [Bryobacteraceae bacterium]|nr:sigma-70 family RNA polymerase sigma factor [Bryobacteraceae bacterium]
MAPSTQRVTQLLIEWGNGSHAALEELMPLVYAELHKMARRYMNQQNPLHTLQTTALIHEAYLRLAGEGAKQWQNRAHFFGVAAKAMRHVLVDHARTTNAAKRGGAVRALRLDEEIDSSGERMAQLIALDDALTDLAKLHQRQSEVIELRFFGGLSVQETAELLKVSPETVARDWRIAKAWLHGELNHSHDS